METTEKRPSGRPRKADSDKVKYQRIAVYADDYSKLVEEINKRNNGKPVSKRVKLTDAFKEMVNSYLSK